MKSLALAAVLSLTAAAQTPPPILRLIRNPNALSPKVYANAGARIEVLGMNTVTGTNEFWTMEQHPNFASIETVDKALSGSALSNLDNRGASQDEILGPGRVLIAVYRDGWGYHSEDAIRMLPRTRYFNVTIYRVRPDADSDMHNLLMAHHSELDSMNLSQPDLVYHVISGGSSGLYLVLSPLASLRAMDERVNKMPLEVEAKSPAVSEFARETLMFRIDPQMSYVSEEFAAGDPSFWRGQE
ncbi:MAG TPA: hypothetical protein VKB88_05270 [Bryobacteraceae bacterium]|nr:hypothetical protein [Bryobacteraceae bacterium]